MTIRSLALGACVAGVLVTSGCAAARAPVTGVWYTDVKADSVATSNSAAPKVGRATAKSFLGLVATGDCSTATAAANGSITKIAYVDYESTSILGLYAETTTVVHGE